MQEEIWKDIKGYEGFYQVSNLGRVKSLQRNYNGRVSLRKVPEKILKFKKDRFGYLYVTFSRNGCKLYSVHRLVAKYFIDNKNNYNEVNHIDCNKENNSVDNLEWCTHKHNLKHACDMNLIIKGENHYKTKIKKQDVIDIRNDKRPQKIIALDYNLSRSAISNIKNKKVWKHI